VYKDVVRLADQNLSIPVQDAAFDVLKHLVQRPDVADVEKLIDCTVPLISANPQDVISVVRLLANKIRDLAGVVKKFGVMPQSHATVELLQAVISPNAALVSPQLALEALRGLERKLAALFFRFCLGAFGPLPDFLPFSLTHISLISLYLRSLAKLCDSNAEEAKAILQIEQFGPETPRELDELAGILAGGDGEMSEAKGAIVVSLLLENCVKLGLNDNLLYMLALAARVPALGEKLALGQFWGCVPLGLMQSPENVDRALFVIESLPKCPDVVILVEIWDALVYYYGRTKRACVVKVIRRMLKQTRELSVEKLIPLVKSGLAEGDKGALKMARLLGVSGLQALLAEKIWGVLGNLVGKSDDGIARCVGKLCLAMVTEIQNCVLEPGFLLTVLRYVYGPEVPFAAVVHFVMFLTHACASPVILAFLYRRHFSLYLEQLPWRYPEEKAVAGTLTSCAALLVQHYGAQVNISINQ
jgi:hypothetical protein